MTAVNNNTVTNKPVLLRICTAPCVLPPATKPDNILTRFTQTHLHDNEAVALTLVPSPAGTVAVTVTGLTVAAKHVAFP